MSYSSATIRDVVEFINRKYFLPAIQRPFVWEPEQIIGLFDSLMKGYPISSFLFWEIKPENRTSWDIYDFIENFKYGCMHNKLVEPDGREITLVLDGQQRLTSLLIGLRGTYTIKLKHKRWDSPGAWVKQRLYLNLLKDPGNDDESDDLGVTYGFKFFTESPQNTESAYWLKVGTVLDFDDEDAFHNMKDDVIDSLPGTITRDVEKIFRKNIERLYRLVWMDEVISYYTEKNQSYDRVLDIFIRANDGGTKLSKSDLLLSMITSKWDGVNAREEIYQFVDYINDDLERKNSFDKDFIMRSCLVVSDLDQRYKINNFTSNNLSIIQRNWGNIKSSVEACVRLINRFGIDRDTLSSANALMPIIYYFSKLGGRKLDGTTPFDIQNSERIRKWLIGALLNNVFGGTSDQTIGISRLIVKEALKSSDNFPYKNLVSGLREKGRISDFDNGNINTVLDTRFGQKKTFLAVSLFYDNHNWGSTFLHVDHIIPRSLCTRQKLSQRGLSQSQIDKIIDSVDKIGNLQLLLGRENQEKSNQEFEQWIQTRSNEFLGNNLIPSDQSLWSVEKLYDFVAARENLIKNRLKNIGFSENGEM